MKELNGLVNNVAGMGHDDGARGLAGGLMGVQRPKRWLSAALAAAGVASSLIGGHKASQAARAAERRQRAREAEEDSWYNRRYNEDYIDTAAGQNLVRRAKDYAREQWQRAAGAQAVAGGTDAAAAAAKEAGNKMVGDTIANVAATDQTRKAAVDTAHRQARAQFAQQDMTREMQRAQSITDAAGSASNALLSAAGAIEQANSNKVDLSGGKNYGKDFQGVTGIADTVADSDAWAKEHGVG